MILKQFVTLLAKDKNVSVLDSVPFLHGKQLLQKFTRVSLRYKTKTKQNGTKKPQCRLGLQAYETKIVVRASKLPFSQHNFMQEKFVLRVFNECLTTLLTCFNTIMRSSFQSPKCKILTIFKYQDRYCIEYFNRLH